MSRAPKARLSSGKRVSVTSSDDVRPGLGASAPVIRTTDDREALPVRAGRSLLGMILLALFMIVLIYIALAATVMVVLRADGQNVLVLRGAFPPGQAPSGVVAYVSSAPVDYTLVGKATAAVTGVPAGSVVQIVAGPSDTISTDSEGFIVANGTRTAWQGKVTPVGLNEQYVAICLSGACPEGEAVLISTKNILGEAKGAVTLKGVKPFTPPVPAPSN